MSCWSKEADAMLARLTVQQLRDGLKKANDMLLLNQGLETCMHIDHDPDLEFGHPGRHPSDTYLRWSEADFRYRRLQLISAITDINLELKRRGESSPPAHDGAL